MGSGFKRKVTIVTKGYRHFLFSVKGFGRGEDRVRCQAVRVGLFEGEGVVVVQVGRVGYLDVVIQEFFWDR